MSNIDLIIEERAASIGNFMVGRLLPFRQKRAVGPFVFIDHMGPVKMSERENMDILPHPHIGALAHSHFCLRVSSCTGTALAQP